LDFLKQESAMANPKKVNEDLVRQEVRKGRMGDRALGQKPGKTPGTANTDVGIIWDDDQRQLAENQDMSEIEKAEQKGSA
jgi:hypothetical protein